MPMIASKQTNRAHRSGTAPAGHQGQEGRLSAVGQGVGPVENDQDLQRDAGPGQGQAAEDDAADTANDPTPTTFGPSIRA